MFGLVLPGINVSFIIGFIITIDTDILDVEGSGENPTSLLFKRTRYGNDCSIVQMESTRECGQCFVLISRYSVDGCVSSRDNRWTLLLT